MKEIKGMLYSVILLCEELKNRKRMSRENINVL